MITWVQKYFNRHFKLVFLLILAAMGIPLVLYVTPSRGGGQSSFKALEKPFFSYNLASEKDQKLVFGDAELSIYLQVGFMPLSQAQLQDYALNRAATLSLAKTYGLPAPTKAELDEQLTKMRMFQGTDGKVDGKRYADFVDSLKNNPQLTRADLARVLSDEVIVAKMEAIIGGPGYVLPAEVKTQMDRAMSEWTVSVATTSYDAFNPDIAVNELGLSSYFDQNIAKYKVPPRVSVDYVLFKPAAYTASIEVNENDLLAYYKDNPARFPAGTDAAATPADSIPPAMHAAVEAAFRAEHASKVAARTASDFAFAIFDQKVGRDSADLNQLITQYNVAREHAPLFTAAQPPKALGWTATVAQEAFKLGNERFFSDPLALPDGSAVVLLWNQTLPETTPDLASIRDTVIKDYKENERRRMFSEAGGKWRVALQSKIASGMTLEAAAASMTNPKFEVVSYPAFSLRKPPEKIDQAALSALEGTPAGQLSGFTVSGQNGLIVQVISKTTPAISQTSPEYSAALEQMTRNSAGLAQNTVLSGLVERELAKSADTTKR